METTFITHSICNLELKKELLIEQIETPIPFNELILSWNGFRPQQGFWVFSISLFQQVWSEYLPLAMWGKEIQKTFSFDPPKSFAKSYQDVALVKQGFGTGYRVRIEAHEGATLQQLQSVTANLCRPAEIKKINSVKLSSVLLAHIPKLSQQKLIHPRAKDLCSPTSTTAVINFLQKKKELCPIFFASQVFDQTFDLYGNWILNTAAAYEALEGAYHTSVVRLPHFSALHEQLTKGLPVIVSIQGPLVGAPLPYQFGHLIVIIGYQEQTRRVLCMDPAFQTNDQTIVSYCMEDFLSAWTERRRNLSYIFKKMPS